MNIKFVFQNEKIRKNAVDTTYMMRIWIITIVGNGFIRSVIEEYKNSRQIEEYVI